MSRNLHFVAELAKRHAYGERAFAIRKLVMILLFTGVGLVATAAVGLELYENRFYQVLRLKNESERISEAARRAKAAELADKVLCNYQSMENLSFTSESIYHWCEEGSWRSRLPMNRWTRREVSTVHVDATPASLRTQILVKGKPLYTLLLHKGRYSEFKWPWNGVTGERTNYPLDTRSFRLRRGVDPELLCDTGPYWCLWVGPDADQPADFKRMMADGYWIGTLKVQGRKCDVVFAETHDVVIRDDEQDPLWDRWDFFYVGPQGFVVLWDIILRSPDALSKGLEYNRVVMAHYYRDFQTERIPPERFSPSKALLERCKGWRVLTESESAAELQSVLGSGRATSQRDTAATE